MSQDMGLSEQNLQMVNKIARYVAFKYLPTFENSDSEGPITREELYHQGVIGCIKAKKKYDPSRGSFVQYAYMFIKGEMISLLRMKGALIHVPQKKYQEMAYLKKQRGMGKSDGAIAYEQGWSMDKVVELDVLKPKMISTSKRADSEDCSTQELGDLLPFKGKSAEALLQEEEILEIISMCIKNISRPESRLVLIFRYKQEKTLAQLSAHFNCSIETVRNRQAEAESSVSRCLKRNGVELNGK